MSDGVAQLQAGWEHHARGRFDQAERLYREVLAARPDHPDAWCLLGALDLMRGRFAEAAASFREAIRSRPGYAQAHNNLGVALSESNQPEAAEACYREAIRLQADYAEAYNNLGSTLRDLRRHDDALDALRRAAELRPDYAEAWNNLGVTLTDGGSLIGAIDCLRRAVAIKPDYPEAWLNLGNALRDAGDAAAGRDAYARSLQLRPDYPEARYNRSLLHLQLGDEAAGWQEYEWRWRCRQFPRHSISSPLWDGSPLLGRTVLLLTEQGLGDAIQFVRFAGMVKASGGRSILACPAELIGLFGRAGLADEVVPNGTVAPRHDLHVPLMSLPRLVGAVAFRPPDRVPYLAADPARVEHWRDRLASLPGRQIGVAWQGNPRFRGDRRRSFPLAALEPLGRLEGVTLVSLQKGEGRDQLDAPDRRFPIADLGPDYDRGDFDDTAAILTCLDLVIACDSAITHLAGALGRPVWVAHGAFHEWRWTPEATAHWYPTARVFRQDEPGRWDLVIAAMAATLRGRIAPRIAIEITPAELIDRLTILEIKRERIRDAAKMANVELEYYYLKGICDRSVESGPAVLARTADLKAANLAIWEVEEILRQCEQDRDFGPRFIEAARTVYRENDRRAALKRAINEHLGSPSREEKSYPIGLSGR